MAFSRRKYLVLGAFGLVASGSFYFKLSKENKDTLLSVIMITRHGARTPLHLIQDLKQVEFKSDLLKPYVNSNLIFKSLDGNEFTEVISFKDQKYLQRRLKGGAFVGQLTCVGEKQMFLLGKRLRDKYIHELKFISQVYNPNEIYVRSTQLQRTINSAKSVLGGLFQISEEKSLKDPFIIHINDLRTDYIYPNLEDCPMIRKKRKLLKNNFQFYTTQNEYTQFVGFLKKKFCSLNDKDNSLFVYEFLDEIHSRQFHKLPIPQDVLEFIQKANRFASMELAIDMKSNFYKFQYFSAHDITLIALLSVLGLSEQDKYAWPPFGADLIFELWRDKEANYLIKVFYCGEIASQIHCSEFIDIFSKCSVNHDFYQALCTS